MSTKKLHGPAAAYIAGMSWEQFKTEADEQTAAVVKHGGTAWYSNYDDATREKMLRDHYDQAVEQVKPAAEPKGGASDAVNGKGGAATGGKK